MITKYNPKHHQALAFHTQRTPLCHLVLCFSFRGGSSTQTKTLKYSARGAPHTVPFQSDKYFIGWNNITAWDHQIENVSISYSSSFKSYPQPSSPHDAIIWGAVSISEAGCQAKELGRGDPLSSHHESPSSSLVPEQQNRESPMNWNLERVIFMEGTTFTRLEAQCWVEKYSKIRVEKKE